MKFANPIQLLPYSYELKSVLSRLLNERTVLITEEDTADTCIRLNPALSLHKGEGKFLTISAPLMNPKLPKELKKRIKSLLAAIKESGLWQRWETECNFIGMRLSENSVGKVVKFETIRLMELSLIFLLLALGVSLASLAFSGEKLFSFVDNFLSVPFFF